MVKRTGNAPKAFISYSWDGEAHKTWVREFASKLVKNRVDVILDQWHLQRGQSVTEFMETSIKKADFVLVICTPAYARKSNARKGGVGYEQQIVSGHMALGMKQKRFVPVLRSGSLRPGRNGAVPTVFTGLLAVDLRQDDKKSDVEFEDLVRAIFAEPRHQPPPLGEAPMFARPAKAIKRTKSRVLRLPVKEIDGYGCEPK